MEMLPVRRMDQARLAVERSTGANCRRQRRRPHRRCSWCTASRLRSHSSRRIARPVGLHDLLPPSPTDIRITLAQSLFTDILLPLQLIIALLYAPLHTICSKQPRLPAAMLNRAEYIGWCQYQDHRCKFFIVYHLQKFDAKVVQYTAIGFSKFKPTGWHRK